jgi:hypothetical protein
VLTARPTGRSGAGATQSAADRFIEAATAATAPLRSDRDDLAEDVDVAPELDNDESPTVEELANDSAVAEDDLELDDLVELDVDDEADHDEVEVDDRLAPHPGDHEAEIEDDLDDEHDDAGDELTPAERLAQERALRWNLSHRTLVHLLAASLLSLWVGIFTIWVAYPTCPQRTTLKPAAEAADCYRLNGDALYFDTQARLLSEGKGFANPAAWNLATYDGNAGDLKPGAGHPPAYTIFLATLDVVGLDSVNSHRLVEVFVGALGVFLIGLAGFRIGRSRGDTVGPIAAVLAATYPMIWINNFRYLSESIYIPIVALLLLAAYSFWAKPSRRTAVAYGLMIGVAGLVRGEGIFLLAFTLPLLLWGLRSIGWRPTLKLGGVVTAVALGIMAPWVVYNLVRFEAEPVFITSGTGSVLMYGSCDDTFYGPGTGYYSFKCLDDRPDVGSQGESADGAHPGEDEFDLVARQTAMDYLTSHKSRLPAVAAARVGRLWDVYAPFQNATFNDVAEGRGRLPSLMGLWYYWALLPFAALGGYQLVKRGIALSPIVGMAAAVTLTAMMSFGVTRYRVPADVGLVIVAAVGIDAFVVWFRARRRQVAEARAHAPFVLTDDQFDAFFKRLDEELFADRIRERVGAGTTSRTNRGRREGIAAPAGGGHAARGEPASAERTPHERVNKIVRLLLAREDLRESDLAAGLKVDLVTVSSAMEGARAWSVDELYALAWFFGEPVTIFHDDPAELFELFRNEP